MRIENKIQGTFCFSGLLLLALCSDAAAIGAPEDEVVPPAALAPADASGPNVPAARFPNSFDEGPKPDELPELVPLAAFPWVIAVVSEGKRPRDSYLCGGVVVGTQWALTAAHCIGGLGRRWPVEGSPYVIADTADLGTAGRSFPIGEIVVHPEYDSKTLANDLALVRVDPRNGGFNSAINLAGVSISEQAGEVATIVGWGVTNKLYLNNKKAGRQLQLIQSSVQDSTTCFSTQNFPNRRNAGAFCGLSTSKYQDICDRFGGSPIVLLDQNGERYLAGVVSADKACPTDGKRMNVYVDVQARAAWIKSVVSGKGESARKPEGPK